MPKGKASYFYRGIRRSSKPPSRPHQVTSYRFANLDCYSSSTESTTAESEDGYVAKEVEDTTRSECFTPPTRQGKDLEDRVSSLETGLATLTNQMAELSRAASTIAAKIDGMEKVLQSCVSKYSSSEKRSRSL